ncbi:zf-HC2 domain-containing protein [Anaerolentibacter hominis]|uniref:zf-HC2 domain-containing protein n=1 Tax=Anaerolentibacter hominis TaxID=3079009 RepID=UPI0031B899B0
MKSSCAVIRDLLPLYYDQVCSKESRELVEEHVKECEACREELDKMGKPELIQMKEGDLEQAKVQSLKHVKKRIRWRGIIIAGVTAAIILVLLITGASYMKTSIRPVEYSSKISVEIDGAGNLCAFLNGMDYDRVVSKTVVREEDGREVSDIYFYFSSSLWSRVFNGSGVSSAKYVVAYQNIAQEQKSGADGVSRIYYFTGSYDGLETMSEEERSRAAADAVLLFEAE